MKIARRPKIIGLLLIAGLFVALHFARAQATTDTGAGVMTDPDTDVSDLSDLAVELKALEMATPLAASNAPASGNFYSAQHAPGSASPWPPLPANFMRFYFWPLDTNIFVLDDLNFDYNDVPAKTSVTANSMMVQADVVGPPNPPGGGGSDTNSPSPQVSDLPDYGTNLYVVSLGMVSGSLTGVASNTLEGVEYAVQTNSDLSTTNWVDTGQFILGSDATNWTQFILPPPLSTNNLFYRLQSELSSDASGLPNWWETKYFGTNAVNPNAPDSAGDGWTIYQKYEMGVNPNQFVTPPAPQGVTVSFDANTSTAIISWLPSPGSVTGYTVQKIYSQYNDPNQINTFSATATAYTNSVAGNLPNPAANNDITVTYSVQANYAGGASAWSAAVPLEASTSAGSISEGTQGNPVLVVSAMPTNTTAIELTEISEAGGVSAIITNVTISIGNFTNGVIPLPNIQTTNGLDCYWVAQALNANGSLSASYGGLDDYANAAYSFQTNWIVTPFYDERAELKQNLIFQLRAATENAPFSFNIPLAAFNGNINAGAFGANAGEYSYPTNYAYAGFFQYANPSLAPNDYGIFDVYLPFEENYLFRNFVFTPADVDINGDLTNIVDNEDEIIQLATPPKYWFQTEANGTGFPDLLTTNNTSWLFYDTPSPGWDGLISITTDYSSYCNISLSGSAQNWFGLPYAAANLVYQLYAANTTDALGLQTNVLSAGHTLSYSASANENEFDSIFGLQNIYFEVAQPKFQTAEYDFWNANAVWNSVLQANVAPVLPGSPTFSPTNQSQLLLTSVGNNNFQVAGYAKLAVTNSVYTGVYGFLAQYFTNAYEIDTNGNVTTNIAGVLSPYGNFLATQPGPAALVTMPDIDTGRQGTGIVYAVSLNLDANHDGTMDLSYNGTDTTSPNSPYVFWANNNYDRWKWDTADETNYMDDVLVANCPYTPSTATADCNYRDVYGNRVIPDTRDLEDYARLWVSGIDSNLLANLPAGSTVTLNWGDVGNPNTNNPTIDLFQAVESDGGIGYLTNETTATEQINPVNSDYVGRIEPGQSVQLNASFFSGWAGNHFIWCGVSNGTGGLNLTIMDASSNVLAQATVYIQIKDVKQMYERWTLGDDLGVAPLTNALPAIDNGFPVGLPGFQYPKPQDTNTPYILFVHGWNMESWEKDRFAETAYKRLYWQGYQGRFGLLRWPTGNDFTGDLTQLIANPTEKDNYDGSEYNASLSGVGLLNKLTSLNAEYPGHVYVLAHSMGNVVTGEALRLAGDNQIVNTYVASQAAVSAHAYDASVPDYSFERSVPFLFTTINYSFGPITPDIYVNWFATNNGGGAGQVINFYNTNDYALNANHWQLDQLFKPDVLVSKDGSTWNYGYNGSASDPAPWNNFFKTNDVTDTKINFDIVNTITNRYEVMAYAAQSYTTALGATPGVHIAANLDLPTIWPSDPGGGNYTEHFWHSAEFRSDSIGEWNYWSTLLFSGTVGFGLDK